MNQTKMIEKILADKEYCAKVAGMSLEEFKAELAQRGLDLAKAEACYKAVKISVAGGALEDDDLEAVAGGVGMCECAPGSC